MKLLTNTTSPFARLVRIAAIEKGLADEIREEIVDPWGDAPDFLSANPAGRVPVLISREGTAISEAALILAYLDAIAPEPALYPKSDLARTLARAGDAIGALEASTAIIIGRKSNPDFDAHMVGKKRLRSMASGLSKLNADPPPDFADGADISSIAAATALDYILFRFPETDWLAERPTLAAWRGRQGERPSLARTMPFI